MSVNIYNTPQGQIMVAVCNKMLKTYDISQEILNQFIESPDPVINFNSLDNYIHLLSSCPTSAKIYQQIIESINQLKAIKIDDQHFKKTFGDNYKLMSLVLPSLEIMISTKKLISDNTQFLEVQSQILGVESTITGMVSDINPQTGAKVGTAYLALSKAFSALANSAHDIKDAISSIEKADEYFRNLVKDFPTSQNKIYGAENLAIAYSNCAIKHSEKPKDKIFYLKKAYEIQEEHGFDVLVTLHNLGFKYCNVGETYFEKCVQGDKLSYTIAYQSYQLAIEYMDKALNCNTTSKSLNQENLVIFEGLALIYERLGSLTYDVKLIKKAVLNYQKSMITTKDQYKDFLGIVSSINKCFISLKNSIDDAIGEIGDGGTDNHMIVFSMSNVSPIELFALPCWSKELQIEYKVIEKSIYQISLKYVDAAICKEKLEERISLLDECLNPAEVEEIYDDSSPLVIHPTELVKPQEAQEATNNNELFNYRLYI